MVRITKYHASKSGELSLGRICSHCGHAWVHAEHVEGATSSLGAESAEGARAAAAALFADKAKDVARNRGMLCERCAHFATLALAEHFPKGYAAGLLSKYGRSLVSRLALFVGCVWLPVLAAWRVVVTWGEVELGWGLTIVALLVLIAAGMAVYQGLGFVVGVLGYPWVRRRLQRASQEQLLTLARACYERNGDSLAAPFFTEEVPWPAWLTTLLRTGNETRGPDSTA